MCRPLDDEIHGLWTRTRGLRSGDHGDVDSMDREPNPWAGPSGRRRRIHQELRHLGDTRRWWADACRFIQDDTLDTGAHMTFHALRELNGTLLDLLVPIADVTEDPEHAKERARLAAVLS